MSSLFLLEHTWGLPSVYDQINWNNKDFEKVVNTAASFNNCRQAWLEQRAFFDVYLDTVRGHPVHDIIEEELHTTFDNVTRPDLQHFKVVSPTETFILFRKAAEPIRVAFDEKYGSISTLSRSDTIYWTDPKSQLAKFVYITYNETDFQNLSETYGNPGYDKPNSTANAEPQSRVWLPALKRLYQSRLNENEFLAVIDLPPDAVSLYGGFAEIWLLYKFLDETSVLFEWTGLNKTATRLAEASMIKFTLPMEPSCSLNQYDARVDVQQTATKSSFYQRGVDSFSCQTTLSAKCFITLNVKSYDTPLGKFEEMSKSFEKFNSSLACPILKDQEPTALPFPAPANATALDGMAFNLHNNVWDTNYIYWYPLVEGDESWRARFLITFDGSCS